MLPLTPAVLLFTQASAWSTAPPLPDAVTNNAVAAVVTGRGPSVLSFLGLESSTRWDGITNRVYAWTVDHAAWIEVAPVPGPGRLAATAQAVRGMIFLFGGYTVTEDGTEQSLASVDVYDPETDKWRSGAPIPIPVDDAVSGVWRDSLVYLISGWHDEGNVSDVQIYDPAADRWLAATPIPGPPVFGHAGAIVGDAIIYIDGTRANAGADVRFVIESSSWRGDIDPMNPTRVAWRRLPDHPGPPLYRAGAVALPRAPARRRDGGTADGVAGARGTRGPLALFAGGTTNPYNYDGIGYDGAPSEPLAGVFGYDAATGEWEELSPLPEPVMDLRGIALAAGRLVIAGGMGPGQRVRRRVLSREIAPLH